MKVHFFETEPWIKTLWKAAGIRMQAVWTEGMLTPAAARTYGDAEIICTDMSVLNQASLEGFQHLKLIAVRSTGVDHIDLDYCGKHGITVCNVPAYAGNAVAEHVFALLLALSRHVVESVRRTRGLDFSWAGIQGFELRDKALALIGTGAIGRRVAAIAGGFGMTVQAVDDFPNEAWAAANRVRYVSLDDALRGADVVTLHVPATPETRHLLCAERFDLMKDGVVIINTARGSVIDPRALLAALAHGKVAAAGLDVLPNENDLMGERERMASLSGKADSLETQLANHLLLQHPRVLVTPHCAFFTRESTARLMDVTIGNIEAFVRGTPRNQIVRGAKP